MTKQLWGKWQSIISDVLTIGLAVLPQIDAVYHTHITSNPGYAAVLAMLGALGIHAHILQNNQLEL
jgi:hypothetical protein